MITHLTDSEGFGGDFLTVEGDGYRHLFRSRRLAVGAELRVVDGLGHARRGVVESVSKRSAEVALGESLPSHEPSLRLDLLVGALRPERADFLVEKATELGAVSIRFLRTERTPRNYGEGRLDRLARVAAGAVEQCHRALLPEISLHDWQDVASLLPREGESYLLAPGSGRALETSRESSKSAHAVLLAGPEGGFSDDEEGRLRDLGAVGVDLGQRLLRVETAVLAAAARLLAAP